MNNLFVVSHKIQVNNIFRTIIVHSIKIENALSQTTELNHKTVNIQQNVMNIQ